MEVNGDESQCRGNSEAEEGGVQRDIRLEGPACRGGRVECVCVCVEGGLRRGIKTIPSIHHWSRSGRQGNAATCGKNL